ncbi:hypothetical protein [Flavobacterium ustbae]|uniref:hypothetical protein n=1 Tax=Flavobacterium ustbae TaxID=2488790 RepID=UPI0013DE1F1E|nr:hypothetical protein [Flavobacterium ustbae]
MKSIKKTINITEAKFRSTEKTISIEELNKRITKSEEDFKNGRYKTTSQLLKKYK